MGFFLLSHPVQRHSGPVTAETAAAALQLGNVLIDCTGTKSVFRDRLLPAMAAPDGDANTFRLRLEYALVVTFLYGQPYH